MWTGVFIRIENEYFSVRSTYDLLYQRTIFGVIIIGVAPNLNFDSVEGIIRCSTSSMRSLLPCTPVPCTNCCLGCVVVAAKCSRRPSALSLPIVNSWVSCELRNVVI